jgi:hypothetical protein
MRIQAKNKAKFAEMDSIRPGYARKKLPMAGKKGKSAGVF